MQDAASEKTPDLVVDAAKLARFRTKVVDLLEGPFSRWEADYRAGEIIDALRNA